MKKMFVKVLSLLLVTAAFAVLVGCKNNADDGGNSGPAIDQALVGQWIEKSPPSGIRPITIVLKSDGTGTFDGQPFTWTATNGSVKVTDSTGSVLFEGPYTVSSTAGVVEFKFTLRGSLVTYTKQ